MDPKGRGVANNTDYYIALKLEDPVYIGDKKGRRAQEADEDNWLNFIIAAPHSVVEGYFDGAVDMHGNIIKVSAHYPDKVSFSAEYDETGVFVAVITDSISQNNNDVADSLKATVNAISDLVPFINKHYHLSGSYPDQKNDDAPLNDWWTKMVKETEGSGLWSYNIISPNQVKLRKAVENMVKNEEYIIQYP